MSKYKDAAKGFEEGQAERPDYCTDEHLEFLDELRESGECNMFAARPYLIEEYCDLDEKGASAILGYWMKSFGKPNR